MNASLRDEFLRRSLCSSEELDRLGFVSHDQLDLWADAGVLEEAVHGLEEAWGLGALKGAAFDAKIMRGQHGRFGGGVGGPRLKTLPGRGKRIKTLQGKRGGVKGKSFGVYPTPPIDPEMRTEGAPEHMTHEALRAETPKRDELLAAGDRRLARLAAEARRGGDHARGEELERARADAGELEKHGQKELYDRGTKKIEKRITRNLKKASKKGRLGRGQATPVGAPATGHELTKAETDFNAAGKVSQKTLLSYVNDAASKPTTAEMFRSADGQYHPSRAALHAHIIDGFLRQRNKNERGEETISFTNPYMKGMTGDVKPRVLFTGGGYASGKGGIVKQLRALGAKRLGLTPEEFDKNTLVIDPDLIKAELPEFQASALHDPEANIRVYQEAWDIAQHLMAEAQARKLNVIVDGITNTHADEVASRVKGFVDAGYDTPEIHYVSIPTNVASERAIGRAAKGKTAADRRMIPDTIMRAVHRDVSATIPGVMAKAKKMGADVHVWDNYRGNDEVTGKPKPAEKVASADHETGQITHHDSGAFQKILDKANESIPGVKDPKADEPVSLPTAGGAEKPGSIPLKVDPELAKIHGAALDAAIPETPGRRPQPHTDLDEALQHAKDNIDGYRALLDLGQGISQALGADVHDMSAGKDFEDAAGDIEQNMDRPHVLIAPVKGRKRAAQKLAADGTDASALYDALRGTVTVPRSADMPHAIDTIVRQARARGWTVEHAKNRFANAEGDARFPQNGYGDVNLTLRAPVSQGGHAVELQVNTNPMWWAKEVGPGHKFYEVERHVNDEAAAQGNRALTPDEQKLIDDAQAAAKPIYDRAAAVSQQRGGDKNIGDTLTGDAASKKELASSLSSLQDRLTALPKGA